MDPAFNVVLTDQIICIQAYMMHLAPSEQLPDDAGLSINYIDDSQSGCCAVLLLIIDFFPNAMVCIIVVPSHQTGRELGIDSSASKEEAISLDEGQRHHNTRVHIVGQ